MANFFSKAKSNCFWLDIASCLAAKLFKITQELGKGSHHIAIVVSEVDKDSHFLHLCVFLCSCSLTSSTYQKLHWHAGWHPLRGAVDGRSRFEKCACVSIPYRNSIRSQAGSTFQLCRPLLGKCLFAACFQRSPYTLHRVGTLS